MKTIIFSLLLTTIFSCTGNNAAQNAEKDHNELFALLNSTSVSTSSPVTASNIGPGFWVGIQNNILTVGNLPDQSVSNVRIPGDPVIESAVFGHDCKSIYAFISAGVIKVNLLASSASTTAISSTTMIHSSPDNRYFIYGHANIIRIYDTLTDVDVVTYTFTGMGNIVDARWTDTYSLDISYIDGVNQAHIYKVNILDWSMARVTQSSTPIYEWAYLRDPVNSKYYFLSDVTPSLYSSSDLISFTQELFAARSLTKDLAGNIYVAQGVPNGSTQYMISNGVATQVFPYTMGSMTIMDFCKASIPSP